jgi:hypothetical protein
LKAPSKAGTVKIAVWKDNQEILKHQDVFTNYSQDVFYDFVRPLKLLDSPGWSSSIRISPSDDGLFTFSSDEKPF